MNPRSSHTVAKSKLADLVSTLPACEAGKLVDAADHAIEGLKDSALDTLAKELKQIELLLDAATAKPRENAAELRWLNEVLFDAKAMAGTFDYPLISQIGESLRCFLNDNEVAGPIRLAIVKHHVQAMIAILRDGHEGNDSEIGIAILTSLAQAIKITHAHNVQ